MPTRRPRRSATQWAQIITDYHQSNLSAQSFCEQHDYSLATFRKWQTRYSGRNVTGDMPSSDRVVELVPATQIDPERSCSLLIELDLGLGMHLKISR